ncbi:SMP-30/gluconolactonase/LRE family protein [Pseudomonas farris]
MKAVFDRHGNLLFVDAGTGSVFRLTLNRQLSVVVPENKLGAAGLAVHKDGRIFIASVGDMRHGSIHAVDPDGSNAQTIIAPDAGYLANDLVFDDKGGFYFTDSRGSSAAPTGGVFYITPDE